MAQTLALHHLRERHDAERRHHALLAAPEHRRDLHRCLDRSAPRRRPAGRRRFSYTYAGVAGLTESPPTNANCVPWTAQCRITIHYDDRPREATHSLQVGVEPADAHRRRNGVLPRRPAVICHNPVNAMADGAGASGPARLDRRCIERRHRPSSPHTRNFCLLITNRRLIWACCRTCWCRRPDLRTRDGFADDDHGARVVGAADGCRQRSGIDNFLEDV